MEDRPPQETEFTKLVEEHQTIAFRTAWLITGSAAEAEEAAQTAFIKAYQAFGRFDRSRPFRPWLLQIVSNEARNRRVAETRRDRLALRAAAEERRPGDAVPIPASGWNSSEAALLDSERRATLIDAVNRLPARDREVIACRYFLDLSEDETAAALKVRRGTVKSRLSRALERLRTEVGDA